MKTPADRRSHRLAVPSPDDYSPAQRDLYRTIAEGPRARESRVVPLVGDDGRLLGPFAIMPISPEVGAAVQSVGAALRFSSGLPADVRELAVLTVAAHAASGFEWVAHEAAARSAGLDDGEIARIRSGRSPAPSTPRREAAWEIVRALLTRRRLGPRERRLADELFDTAQAAELVWLCGYYDMLALALDVFDAPLPDAALSAFPTEEDPA